MAEWETGIAKHDVQMPGSSPSVGVWVLGAIESENSERPKFLIEEHTFCEKTVIEIRCYDNAVDPVFQQKYFKHRPVPVEAVAEFEAFVKTQYEMSDAVQPECPVVMPEGHHFFFVCC